MYVLEHLQPAAGYGIGLAQVLDAQNRLVAVCKLFSGLLQFMLFFQVFLPLLRA